ncbi:hypothetical protein GVM20_00155 [Porphyrobacter sp. SLTP]|uniref:hypothetical protein n=1 Tax=Porphyrobacter sp. SLTP TaxID=2683266 RepID=UPI001412CE80|nr:hypothetical protein [Porphyrobacter sp. SLTP]NBB23534.1 hypothetical protein [Porphyrobacter sp. SLTP]
MTTKTKTTIVPPTAAGSRLSLPGQHIDREAWLRDELTRELAPQGLIEKRWVEDIAYRWVRIDGIRAQVAGLQNRLVKDVLSELDKAKHVREDEEFPCPFPLTREERRVLETYNAMGKRFETDDILDNPEFAWLLGRVTPSDIELLQRLQGLEHAEVRERDRVINQFERRRRLHAQHLIMLIDAKQRGALPVVCDSHELEAVVVLDEEGGSDAPSGREA